MAENKTTTGTDTAPGTAPEADGGTPTGAPTETTPENAPENAGTPKEYGGPKGPEPTRYSDWEQKGRCTDF
ncbi:DUF1674 domain-containing protein [Phaeovibrio sulfidiphilus]|uniref:DUF1674 domain-containing protein n=1 Tax=Phaeovibrio sulfidiphilus TaxID=1220600 RepID=A0A8J6YNL3_9PROT|nr:DUF1674 domain-containing protein [Phaeovibrio sulfidiphilus]MBE1236656.1 DUF1674 domain-containing protein [Phaeovibrio sulfidiphilus]